jgi:8-oxo-dGTP pyrophosphatase MutT (NUDIX family)|tara:strand:+ start:257 stop:706 length:450 start_codon:yes stop_codon:yes gene_type:complete
MIMKNMPHITVATIVERDNRFLMVEEMSDGNIVYNQPAGHLEENETLIQAAVRETFEETGWEVGIRHFLGVYQYTSSANGVYYIRHCFIAEPLHHHEDRALDQDIVKIEWLSLLQLHQLRNKMRSPLVMSAIEDYRKGIRYPLALITES